MFQQEVLNEIQAMIQDPIFVEYISTLIFTVFTYAFTVSYVVDYIFSRNLDRKVKSYELSHFIPCIFSGMLFVYSLINWGIFMKQFLKNEKIDFKDNPMDTLFIQACLQGCTWDLLLGYEYYRNNIRYRQIKNIAYILLSFYTVTTREAHLFAMYWMTDYIDFIREYNFYERFRNNWIDLFIYRSSYVLFKIVFPLVLIRNLWITKYPISDFLFGSLMVTTWYEICLFFFWSIDIIRDNIVKKQEHVEMKKGN